MNVQQYFEKNGYVVLSEALNDQQCKELTQHMFNLYDQGKLTKDHQCPQSDAIYGDPVFDKLLADFANPIGDSIGKQLIPTYTYARIYRPGEVLKKHKDRPECEISATMTLGFDAKFNWPIYFDEEKEIEVILDTGDLAVYQGCEICHWRNPFKGNWHVQVFLHYVDANGPYKDRAFDGRPSLGLESQHRHLGDHQKSTNSNNTIVEENINKMTFKKPIYNSVVIPSADTYFPGFFSINSDNLSGLMFTKEECEKIISTFSEAYPSSARVGGGDGGKINKKIRSANIFNIDNEDQFRWIFNKVAMIVSIVNAEHFDYDITGITHSLQLIQYEKLEETTGHYDWHIDSGDGEMSTRKISLTVQLSDPNKYEGCDLEVFDHSGQILAPKEQGAVNLFPSYMPHRVTPIEQGERYALVIWIHGSRRFR